MKVAEAMARARRFCAEELGMQATVVAAVPEEDGWRVSLEAIVEAEYMRERAQRDLIGLFEVLVDPALTVTAFERKEVRERGTPYAQS
jgi:hypothetical protein